MHSALVYGINHAESSRLRPFIYIYIQLAAIRNHDFITPRDDKGIIHMRPLILETTCSISPDLTHERLAYVYLCNNSRRFLLKELTRCANYCPTQHKGRQSWWKLFANAMDQESKSKSLWHHTPPRRLYRIGNWGLSISAFVRIKNSAKRLH